MTGRLDQVDLDTDLILIVLARADEPLPLNELYDLIKAVDAGPFVFEERFPGGFDEFVRGCQMLRKVHHIEPMHEKVRLTEMGERMADHLEVALDDDESEALHHAGVVA